MGVSFKGSRSRRGNHHWFLTFPVNTHYVCVCSTGIKHCFSVSCTSVYLYNQSSRGFDSYLYTVNGLVLDRVLCIMFCIGKLKVECVSLGESVWPVYFACLLYSTCMPPLLI